MKIEYYEDMLEQEAINKYLNMIANDYNGELAKIFEEKYINKDKEIERLKNIINDFEEELEREVNIKSIDTSLEYNTYIDINNTLKTVLKRFRELKGSNKQ